MSIHIYQILDYLDTHPVCQEAEDVPSLMAMLRKIYLMHHYTDSEALLDMLYSFPAGDMEQLSAWIANLCAEREQLAFSQGIAVGMQLMTEVHTLP